LKKELIKNSSSFSNSSIETKKYYLDNSSESQKSVDSYKETTKQKTNSNQIIIENEERKELDVQNNNIEITDKKVDIENILSKRSCLINEREQNKVSQTYFKKIINNFPNVELIIKRKYISQFQSEEKKNFFKKQGFILTEKSMERMALLIHYILNGIPVLLEGNTGTSKTRTTLTACNYIKKFLKKKNESRKLIRYNLSAETKIDDIISKYVNDQNSLVGLKIQNGPFVKAYIKGQIILFDEINLAPPNVLQCIQQSLDNDFLSIETNGKCLLEYKKHHNFAIVATQNPNKGAFEGKRHELGTEFLSRFQKIFFPDILKEEMYEIAFGIAQNIGYLNNDVNKKKKLLTEIVNFHYELIRETQSQDDMQFFTIREIESVIECLANEESLSDLIMTIYGGRFRQEKKELLKCKLINNNILSNFKSNNEDLPEDFPNCFINKSLIQTVKGVLLSLRNKRNVIIVGNNESGLTQIAEWCCSYYNEKKSSIKKNKKLICFCTKNLECSDLIGSRKISNNEDENNNNELLKFEPRFLYKAVYKGYCVILDSINEAPSRVIERLNCLLDKKNNDEESYFDVPENPENPSIKINENFRIICTSNFEKINQISPSFINRFEVIVLEDQLKTITNPHELVKFLCEKHQNEFNNNYEKRKGKINENKTTKKNEKKK